MATSKQRIPSKESSFAKQNFPDSFNSDSNKHSENKNKKHSSSVTSSNNRIQTESKAPYADDLVEDIDNNVTQQQKPKMSFQDMLMMPMIHDTNKKKKRKHNNDKINKVKLLQIITKARFSCFRKS